ncbi:MAG: Smr/MutS family protein [Deltaproteobacteria bacterium]|nr:Smr/MutS family protein [Deltaproteobacteria bacterium]
MTSDPKTLADLDWARLLDAMRDRCSGPSARRGVERGELVIPRDNADDARRALAESAEAFAMLERGEPLPLDGLRDISAALDRLEREGDLDLASLRDVLAVLEGARVLRRFLVARKAVAPALLARCATDPTLDALADTLAAAFEPDGTLSDRASPLLRELRSEIAGLRRRIVGRLEELLERHAAVVSDRFYTQRDGRYVLPIRTDAHEKVHGIVHATSSSGSTVFVEPRVLVPLGNRLKVAEAASDREIARILGILSAAVRDRLHEVRAAAAALDEADVRHAAAVLARDLRGVFPPLHDEPTIDLRVGRHPLLVLDGTRVVPADLKISAGHAMIVSGPNAGGKTVALKTLGLAVLSVRAGLPVAAADGSSVGFFPEVWTDVGDEQSLAASLSTFSAHVTRVARVLTHAAPGSLVLFDEPGAGTDPEQGAALACAVADELCRQKMALAIATHFESLKVLAASDTRMRNASVGFDVERMEPTFELIDGVPGVSSALVVARRYGIPEHVVERARSYLAPESRAFDELVAKLHSARAELERATERAREEETALREAREAADAQLEKLREKERRHATVEGETLLRELAKARDELKAARARLRKPEITREEVEAAAESIAKVASEAVPGGALSTTGVATEEKGRRVELAEIRRGARVFVPRLRADADVIEVGADGRVRVAVGPMKLTVGAADVRLLDERGGAARTGSPKGGADKAAARGERARPAAQVIRTSGNTCDVRGRRVDDAVSEVDAFLDRLYRASEDTGFIIHGHGTGALRDAVRKHLEESRYAARWSPAEQEEGGDGVTLVWLR